MSIIPSSFGRRSNVFDPISLDVWEPFDGSVQLLSVSLPPSFRFSQRSLFFRRHSNRLEGNTRIPRLQSGSSRHQQGRSESGSGRRQSGERRREEEERNDMWNRVERSNGKFLRRFRLPENAKTDQVTAAMENGVLTVKVPKEAAPKPQVTAVEISG